MIPIRDENPTNTIPYVVYFLIIANIVAFLFDVVSGPLGSRYYMVPKAIVTGQPFFVPVNGVPIIGVQPAWITLFTSMFLHAGFWHLGGNMLYLWIFGNNIEDALGHVRFLIFYLLGGIGAAVAHISMNPYSEVPTVGASGAIAAVLGAYLLLYPRNRVVVLVVLGLMITTIAVPAVIVLGIWILFQLLSAPTASGTTGGVAYWAHIGGFVCGIILIQLFGGKRLLRGRGSTYPYHQTRRRDW